MFATQERKMSPFHISNGSHSEGGEAFLELWPDQTKLSFGVALSHSPREPRWAVTQLKNCNSRIKQNSVTVVCNVYYLGLGLKSNIFDRAGHKFSKFDTSLKRKMQAFRQQRIFRMD